MLHHADIALYEAKGSDKGGVVFIDGHERDVAAQQVHLREEIASPVDLVLDGLAAAHGAGVIHRDLKPENVLIDRYRHWRLADFGIANAMGEEIAGTTGTPQFAASARKAAILTANLGLNS